MRGKCYYYLPHYVLEALCNNSPCSSSLNYPDNAEDECKYKGSSKQIDICHFLGQNKKQMT